VADLLQLDVGDFAHRCLARRFGMQWKIDANIGTNSHAHRASQKGSERLASERPLPGQLLSLILA
jgi:hypothetical protein